MKRRIYLLCQLVALSSLVYLTGCATIVKGRTQEVTFRSVPEGAKVIINGREMGVTPLTAQLQRKSDQSVVFEKEGYKSETLPMPTTVNGWFWGNIVLGGLIGSTTDGVSGAMTEYSPSFFNINLTPLSLGSSRSDSLRQNEAKGFVISNYKHIVEEANSGKSGQYLDTLWSLLRVPADKTASAVAKLKEMAATANQDIADFANRVVSEFSR